LNPERWQQVSRIFKSAISLDGPARAAYVADQCGVDESLRADVEKLIESHQKAGAENFIDGVAVEQGASLLADGDVGEQKSSLRKGQQLGSYLILDTLGSGGMGEVYLAQDSRLDRTVALKILSQDVSADKQRMQRFRQEAKVASSLNQPNILTIFEFGEVDSLTFLATEFIDGETLRDYLRGKRLNLGEILEVSIQILAALDAAHEARIVHRDIKPENVMIRRRDHVVKVLDFGLAKVTEKKPSIVTGVRSDEEAVTEFKTAPGRVMGTINYMSPEQAQAQPVDERTDIWSTGVIIYEMVAGMMPFRGATSSHTIVQILEKEPVPLTQLTHGKVPAELQRIVNKSMAKNADERYQTAKDMLIDLRNLQRQLDREAELQRSMTPNRSDLPAIISSGVAVATAETVDAVTESGDKGSRDKRVVLGTVLAVMVIVAATVFGINSWRSARSKSIASAPAPASERKLTYSVTVQKYKDNKPFEKPFQLAKEMLFERGYQLRLNISSPQSGYLYILNEGPHDKNQAPEFVVLFPSPTSNSGSAFVTEDRKFQIPEKSWFHLDSDKGTEKVWLIFAPTAIPDLESVRAFANPTTQGLITDAATRDAAQSFLKNHSESKPTVEQNEERKETTLTARGDVLVHVIQLEHQ
jgi:serine/threonine protein kinase